MGKQALSPLVATLLLVLFALIIGTLTMHWSKTYVQQMGSETDQKDIVTIEIKKVDIDTLKDLQIKYLTNQISKDEYLKQEKTLLLG